MAVKQQGRIEVVCGSMFSGKTEELIRRVRRATIARQQVQVFKPVIDDRYHAAHVRSHNGSDFEAIPVDSAVQIPSLLDPGTTVVAIDEAQFFDAAVVAVCEQLADDGLRVICAGLDSDFRGEPFGPMPQLLARAEDVTKLRAICVVCGEEACRTQRLIDGQPAAVDDPVIQVGAAEQYEARCRHCHELRDPRDAVQLTLKSDI